MHWYLAIVHNPGATLYEEVNQETPSLVFAKDPFKLLHDSDDVGEEEFLPVSPMVTIDPLNEPKEPKEVNNEEKEEKEKESSSSSSSAIEPLSNPSLTILETESSLVTIPDTIDLTKDEEKMKIDESLDDDESVCVEKQSKNVVLITSSPTRSQADENENQSSSNKRKRIKSKKSIEQEEAEKAKKELEKKLRDEKHYQEKKKHCNVIILDSLGHSKIGAIRNIKEYLKKEALEKKKIETLSAPKGTHAKVPLQPNHCDCGVYLLKYFATFMSDPEKYLRLVFVSFFKNFELK